MRPLLILLAAAGPLCGQAYTLDVREAPAAGKSATVEQESSQRVTREVKDAATGEVFSTGGFVRAERAEYVLAVQRTQGRAAVEFTREYTRADATEGGVKRKRPLQGRKVGFEVKDGKLLVSGADGADRRELEEAGPEPVTGAVRLLLPAGAVKAGESWAVPVARLKPLVPGELVEAEGTATGKLVKVYEKDGRRYGVMEFRLSVALKVGRYEAMIQADAAIDGKGPGGTYKTEWTLTGARRAEAKGRAVTVGGTTRGTTAVTVSER